MQEADGIILSQLEDLGWYEFKEKDKDKEKDKYYFFFIYLFILSHFLCFYLD